MQLVLISPQISVDSEIEKVIALFELGLEVFHIRKPNYSKDKLIRYIEKIPAQYHNRIMVHSHPGLALKFNLRGIHLTSATRKMRFKMWKIKFFVKRKKPDLKVSTSFHKLSDLDAFNPLYNYVFLSPVFDSISKKDYQSGFNEFSLKKALDRTKYNVFALGGVNVSNISKAKEFGFKGGALLGGIWTEKDPVETLIQSLNVCKELTK
ncbi:MAG: thiamine phosphate synthase [Bacteroidetes bacterium]|nr:thiamine phosphate synthase [Bacteroidota bacterium]